MSKHPIFPDNMHGNYYVDETVSQTPIAKHLNLFGGFNTSLHARKEGE